MLTRADILFGEEGCPINDPASVQIILTADQQLKLLVRTPDVTCNPISNMPSISAKVQRAVAKRFEQQIAMQTGESNHCVGCAG